MKKFFIILTAIFLASLTSCVQKEDPYSWSSGQTYVEESYNVTPQSEPVSETPKPQKYETKVKAPAEAEGAVVLGTKYSEKGMLVLLALPSNPNHEDWNQQEYAILGIFYKGNHQYRDDCQIYRHYETAKKNFDAGVVRDAM